MLILVKKVYSDDTWTEIITCSKSIEKISEVIAKNKLKPSDFPDYFTTKYEVFDIDEI